MASSPPAIVAGFVRLIGVQMRSMHVRQILCHNEKQPSRGSRGSRLHQMQPAPSMTCKTSNCRDPRTSTTTQQAENMSAYRLQEPSTPTKQSMAARTLAGPTLAHQPVHNLQLAHPNTPSKQSRHARTQACHIRPSTPSNQVYHASMHSCMIHNSTTHKRSCMKHPSTPTETSQQ